MIDEKNFFEQPIKNHLRTYQNTQKIATGQWDGYTTGCLTRLKLFQRAL